MILKQFEGQDRKDLSMIEVAHAILEQKGDVVDFTELLIEIQNYLELSELELESRMVRFYTDLNIDGRFISLGRIVGACVAGTQSMQLMKKLFLALKLKMIVQLAVVRNVNTMPSLKETT